MRDGQQKKDVKEVNMLMDFLYKDKIKNSIEFLKLLKSTYEGV
jgi:hypothetical protein